MKEWISLYRKGESSESIARSFGTNGPKVRRFLKKSGVKIRTTSESRMVNVPTKKILADFDNGTSARQLIKKYAQYNSVSAMTTFLKRHGRTVYAPKTKADWSFVYDDEDLFLYWLGWMLSDGWINCKRYQNRNRGITTGLTVHSDDAAILTFFQSKIYPSVKLISLKNAVSLRISIPQEVAKYLESWGLMSRKSLTLKPTKALENLDDGQFHQMLAGFVEGDGCIWIQGNGVPALDISSGSISWLEYLKHKLTAFGYAHIGIYSRTLYPNNLIPDVSKSAPHYILRTASRDNMTRLLINVARCKWSLMARKWSKLLYLVPEGHL